MPTVDVNYGAVLIAAIASMVLGGVWYSSFLFGKLWIELMNLYPKDMPDLKRKANRGYAFTFVTLLVTAFVLSFLADYANATTFIEGIQLGFWVWLGFVATTTLGSVLWENKPFKLYVLNNAYNLLSLLLMGAIIAVWS